MQPIRWSPRPSTRCGCGRRTERETVDSGSRRTGRPWPRPRPARATAGRPSTEAKTPVVELRSGREHAVRAEPWQRNLGLGRGQQQPDLQPRRPRQGLVHHRLVIGPDTDEVAPGPRDEGQLLGDGEGGRQAEEEQQRRRQIGDDRGRRTSASLRLTPAAPRVAGIPGSTSSVRVTWDEPANTGPAITRYDVQHREVGSGPTRWDHSMARGQEHDHHGAEGRHALRGAGAGVERGGPRASGRAGASGSCRTRTWPTGTPHSRAGRAALSVAENTPPNTDVGAPIAATRPRRRHADLHPGRGGRGLVRRPVDLRRGPDTDERGAEPRGEGELLGDGPGEGRQGRYRRGQRDDQGDGR